MRPTSILIFVLLSLSGYSQSAEILLSSDYFYKGLEKYKIEDYSGSIADFTKSIEIYSKSAGVYYNRGIAKAKLHDFRGAISDFNKAIEIDPKLIDTYFHRGMAKLRLQDYQGAIADYTTAIETAPYKPNIFAQAYCNRGLAKLKLEDCSATTDFTKAIEIDPKLSEAYYNRGIVRLQCGKKDQGCLDFSKAGELGYTDAYQLIKQYCQ